MNVRTCISLVLALGALAVVRAEEPSAGPYRIEDCVRLGLERNPSLQRLALNVELAKEDRVRATGAYDSRLDFNMTYEDSELPTSANPSLGATKSLLAGAGLSKGFGSGTRLGVDANLNRFQFSNPFADADEVDTAVVSLSLSQDLLRNSFGALDRARIRSADYAHRAARLEYLYERDRLAARIYEAYWDANAALKSYEVNENALARARDLLDTNRKKFQDGLLDETEILAAEAALATREVTVLSTRDAVKQTRDVLLELMAVPVAEWDATEVFFYQTPPDAAPSEAIDMLNAFEEATASRYDLAAVREAQRSAAYDVEARRQEARSELAIFGRAGRGDTDDRVASSLDFDLDVWTVGLQLSVPWSRTAETAARRQAELRRDQVDRDYEALERAVLLECRVASRNLRTSAERVDAARRAKEIEARKLEQEREKLRQGRTTTRIVVDYQDDLEFSELAYVDALTRYQKDLAQFRLVQGVLLRDIGLADAAEEAGEVWR